MSFRLRLLAALGGIVVLLGAPLALATGGPITGRIVVDRPYTFMVGDYRVYLVGVDSRSDKAALSSDRIGTAGPRRSANWSRSWSKARLPASRSSGPTPISS
jgi:hypothetical protein